MQQLYQTQQSLWLSGRILSHEINIPGSNPTQSYCVHVEFKGNWYTFGPGVFWPKQVSHFSDNNLFGLFRESEGKFAFLLMRYFCELHDLKNFEKNFFFHIPSNTLAGVPSVGRGNSLECLQLGEEGMQGPARALAEELASETSSLEKDFPARR